MRGRTSATAAIAAIALAAIAAWPWYVNARTGAARAASLPAPAPVTADYLSRDRTIAFWERAAGERHRGDMLSPSMLSGQYMQRYRERGDLGDVLRALDAANASLRAQPYGNQAADVGMASALLALHRFRDALAVTRKIERYDRNDPAMAVREASLDLELGRYDDARGIVSRLQHQPSAGPAATTLFVRYDELTGHLARARERFTQATAAANAQFAAPAQERAWYHFRSGELAFEAGDTSAAVAAERTALEIFPNYSEANRALARFECARRNWQACLDAARASASVVPYPEVLGYEVDAERALGNADGAARADDLIRAIERIGNAQRVSDRLLAVYYCEHGQRVEDGYRIARRELAARDDIFTEDTLGWCAAQTGRWDEARGRIGAAVRLGTENALLDYHAGAVALHFGARDEARRRFAQALALNPDFHAVYAERARAGLAELTR